MFDLIIVYYIKEQQSYYIYTLCYQTLIQISQRETKFIFNPCDGSLVDFKINFFKLLLIFLYITHKQINGQKFD